MKPSALRVAMAAVLAGAALLTGCSTAPETGRAQFSWLGDGQVESMAVQEFSQMKQQMKVSADPEKNAALKRVGTRVVDAARGRGADLLPPEQWEFVVFEDDQINAFAMPGGKVGFYTGIFPLFETDDDLAVVMGHEIAHVAAHHGEEKVSHQLATQAAGAALALGLGFGGADATTQQLIMASYGLGSSVGFVLPYSRTMESEADHIGLIYSSAAGYDPRASVPFWERMDASGGEKPPEFLSTHPSGQSRIGELKKLIPQVLPIYQQAKLQGR